MAGQIWKRAIGAVLMALACFFLSRMEWPHYSEPMLSDQVLVLRALSAP